MHQVATSTIDSTKAWLQFQHSFPKVIAIVVSASTLLLATRLVCGWMRRCSSNVCIKFCLWLAHTFTPFVVTFTLGFITSVLYSGSNNVTYAPDLFACSASLFATLGSTYSMASYDVDDNKRYIRHLLQYVSYALNMATVMRYAIERQFPWGLIWLGLFFWPNGVAVNTSANIMAGGCSDKESLYLQEYMRTEHLESAADYDPETLDGYNYIIVIKKVSSPNPARVTVSQVWLSNQGILGGSNGTRLKEVCLSYALFRLLRRRFFGSESSDCPESTLPKTHDLVFKGLLSGNAEGNYHTAYRVIETELAFAHDHFFTSGSKRIGAMIMVSGLLKVAIYAILSYQGSLALKDSGDANNVIKSDRIFTLVSIQVLLLLELLQIYIYLSSNDARVELALCSIMPSRP